MSSLECMLKTNLKILWTNITYNTGLFVLIRLWTWTYSLIVLLIFIKCIKFHLKKSTLLIKSQPQLLAEYFSLFRSNILIFVKDLFIVIFYGILPHLYHHTTCTQCSQRPEQGTKCPGMSHSWLRAAMWMLGGTQTWIL